MVTLSRIYTKTGDAGDTGLGDGSRVPKNDARIAVMGSVDELNALLGVLLTSTSDGPQHLLIRRIQNDLFDLGADLCVPTAKDEQSGKCLRITSVQTVNLELAIDRLNAPLATLQSFVLPGGTVTAAWCHLARTVCRRAERDLVTLMGSAAINDEALRYLNRLSDLLFVMARAANAVGPGDVLWVPGGPPECPPGATGGLSGGNL